MLDNLDDYDYELPPDRIAQEPLPNREAARLMVVNRQSKTIDHCHIRDFPSLLHRGDCLVLNDTKVVRARLEGVRNKTGGKFEGLFLNVDKLAAGNVATRSDRFSILSVKTGHFDGVPSPFPAAMKTPNSSPFAVYDTTSPTEWWNILVKGGQKFKSGDTVTLCRGTNTATIEMVQKQSDGSWLVHLLDGGTTFATLESVGYVPLPPYIRGGKMRPSDITTYQTVFASQPGAVAAPTAGLHFTDRLLAEITRRGVSLCHVTLHVGVGTFRPISVQNISEHSMHAEWGNLTETVAAQLRQCRQDGGRIVAVGTTSVRVLETASQTGGVQPFSGDTHLFIRPPYRFHTVDSLLTNFHFPRSTLLILVRTFGGDTLIRHAYESAIEHEYRFYSYGDAMVIV